MPDKFMKKSKTGARTKMTKTGSTIPQCSRNVSKPFPPFRVSIFFDLLDPSSTQQPCRQKQHRPNQRKHCAHRDANQPERQGNEPDDRQKHRREQGQRPAQDEKDAPPNKQYEHLHAAILPLPGKTSTVAWQPNERQGNERQRNNPIPLPFIPMPVRSG